MTSRAAILPYPGDPFLLAYWLHFFDNVWGNEVDKLYIYLNSPAEKEVIDYIKYLCAQRPKINLQYNPIRTDHGICIDRTLDIVEEKYVMLIEDDGFIFKPGIVERAFQYLESGQYDVVGSKRGSCHQEISIRAKELWKLNYEGVGDQGCNFWPNFFFCETELLKKTDRNFCGKAWKEGEIIHPLGDYIVKNEIIYGDTFVNTSLQIRAMIPEHRICYLPQYHGSPTDIDDYSRGLYLFDGLAYWTHVGSLSSGVSGVIRDKNNRCLDRRKLDPGESETKLPDSWCTTEAEKMEWERRIQWWQRFIDYFMAQNDDNHIPEYATLYLNGIEHVINQFGLSKSRIEHRRRIYRILMGI